MRTIFLGFYSDQSKGSVLIGVRIYEGARHFAIQTGSGTHPTHYSMRTGVLSREVHQTGRDVGQSPPSSAEVKTDYFPCKPSWSGQEQILLYFSVPALVQACSLVRRQMQEAEKHCANWCFIPSRSLQKIVLKRTVQAQGKVFRTFRHQRAQCSNRSTKMSSKPSISSPLCERNEKVGGFRIFRLNWLCICYSGSELNFFVSTAKLDWSSN